MAIVWQKIVNGKEYQVRQAGASVRLYTNGVFHSQYNPKYPLGGNIWDLLVLPALFAPERIQRVLILGLGGGAVVRTLQLFLPARQITAIEIDPVHLQIAKEFFGIKASKNTRLINTDAIAWLKNYRGEKFDFILDDLFIETHGQPGRAVNSDQHWCQLLLKNLSTKGVLAVNFDSSSLLRKSALLQDRELREGFHSRYSLSVPDYDNRIAALFKRATPRNTLQQTLHQLESSLDRRLSQRLKAKFRAI